MIRLALLSALALVLPLSGEARADASASELQAADAMTYEGDYAGAARAYEAVVSSGVDDARLYHNLGNAHFRAGALGQAIWAYRRGLECAPDDALREGLFHNLKVTRGALQARYRASHDGSQFIYGEPGGWLYQLTHTVSLELLLWSFVAVWWLLAICLIGRRRLQGRGWGSAAFPVAVLAILMGFMLTGRLATDASLELGVVVADGVLMREGPDPHARGVDVPEGMEIRVLERADTWRKIEVPGGRAGWVDQRALRAL